MAYRSETNWHTERCNENIATRLYLYINEHKVDRKMILIQELKCDYKCQLKRLNNRIPIGLSLTKHLLSPTESSPPPLLHKSQPDQYRHDCWLEVYWNVSNYKGWDGLKFHNRVETGQKKSLIKASKLTKSTVRLITSMFISPLWKVITLETPSKYYQINSRKEKPGQLNCHPFNLQTSP